MAALEGREARPLERQLIWLQGRFPRAAPPPGVRLLALIKGLAACETGDFCPFFGVF